MNVSSLLFLAHVVVLGLVPVIPYVSLLLTGTLVPFTTTSFHVTFELFYGIFPVYWQIFTNHSPHFSTCRNFQQQFQHSNTLVQTMDTNFKTNFLSS